MIVGVLGALALLGIEQISKKDSAQEISPAQATLNALTPKELIKFTEEQEAALRLTATAIVANPDGHLELLKQIPSEIADSLINYQSTSPDGINGSCSGNLVSLKKDGDKTVGAFITVGHCVNSFLLAQGKGHTDRIFDTQIQIKKIENVSPNSYTDNDPAVLVRFETSNPFPTSLTPFPASRIGCKPNVDGNYFAAFYDHKPRCSKSINSCIRYSNFGRR